MELTKERKASPPDAAWPAFEYGNPGSFRRGLGTLPDAISAALGQPVGSPPQPDARVRLQWKLTSLEKEGAGFVATFDTPDGEKRVRARAVVSTAPAHALADALTPVMPEASHIFGQVREAI